MIKNAKKKRCFIAIVLVAALLSMTGCGLFDHRSDRNPTAPDAQSDAELLGNFVAGNGTSGGFRISRVRPGFQINIPTPGAYLVTYQMSGVGSYHLVMRVQAPSLISIGNPGPLEAVSIQKGVIRGNPVPRIQSGAVSLFNWPKKAWGHLFTPTGVKMSLPLSGAVWRPWKPIVIAAVGDSITYGKGSTRGGYVPMLQQKLRAAGYNVIVRKEAVPGEQAASTDARFLSAVDGADIALIMIGTNDVVNTYRCPSPGFCNAGGHVASMINKAILDGIVPFVSTVPPIRTSCDYIWPNADARNLNGQYATVARSRAVPFVDNYSAILREGGDSLFVDCVHFNDRGYNVIADRFFHDLLNRKILYR